MAAGDSQEQATPDEPRSPEDAAFSMLAGRVVRAVSPDVPVISLRRGDKERFGERVDGLRQSLDGQDLDVALQCPAPQAELTPGQLLDLLIGRVNRQLALLANVKRVGDKARVTGDVRMKLRTGDRNMVLPAEGSQRSRMSVEMALVDHVARVTGGGARLILEGGQIVEESAEEFFGSKNPSEQEAGVEEAFVQCMRGTTRAIDGYIKNILHTQKPERRKALWHILKLFERKHAPSVSNELLQESNHGQYLYYVNGSMKLLSRQELLQEVGFVEGGGLSFLRRAASKTSELEKLLSGVFDGGCRIFRLSA